MNIGTVRTFGSGAAQSPVVILLAPKLAKLAQCVILAHRGEHDGLTTISATTQTASRGKRISRKTGGSRRTAASAAVRSGAFDGLMRASLVPAGRGRTG